MSYDQKRRKNGMFYDMWSDKGVNGEESVKGKDLWGFLSVWDEVGNG